MSVSMRARPGSADRHHPTDGFVNIDALVEPQPKAALAYWQTKRGPRAMPAPRDIDPVEIPKLLPYLFLVDVLHEEPPDYFFRIEGEAVRGAVGFARRGQRLSQLREQYGAQYADSYAHHRRDQGALGGGRPADPAAASVLQARIRPFAPVA